MAYTAWSVVYGEQPTAAKWNQLGTNDAGFKDGTNIDAGAITAAKLAAQSVIASKLGIMDYTYVRRTSDQSVPNAAFTNISWNTEDEDTLGAWVAGSPTRITFPRNGLYLVTSNVKFSGGSGGERQYRIYLNGSKYITTDVKPIAGNPQGLQVSTLRRFVAGDYIEFTAYTSSGSGVSINGTVEPDTNFAAVMQIGA